VAAIPPKGPVTDPVLLGPDEKPLPAGRTGLVGWLRRTLAWLGFTSLLAILTLATSLATLVGLAADFFIHGPEPALSVQVNDVRLEERFEDERGFEWLVISFEAAFTGYHDKQILVEWAAFDPFERARVSLDPPPDVNSTERGNWDGGMIEAEATNDQVNHDLIRFVVPDEGRCLFVRVYVYDEDYTRLDYADSLPFDTHDARGTRCAQAEGIVPGDGTPPV
jgi:hypothetical protein